MTPQDITAVVTDMFGSAVESSEPVSWQVETGNFRLLILLSEDYSWLRLLVSITSAEAAQPYWEQLLEANFDDTQETRYALYQGVLWGVFQHSLEGLRIEDFQGAIARLIALQDQGLNHSFNQLAENHIRQIVHVAKQQGQSLPATLQTLQHLYDEGVMGDLDDNAAARDRVLGAWRLQLERFWEDADVEEQRP